MMQLGLFDPPKQDPNEYQRSLWKSCWDWDGPVLGKLCTINSCTVQKVEGGMIYAYTELCRLVEERTDGSWIGCIEMKARGWNLPLLPWPKDGICVILQIIDIWPPMFDEESGEFMTGKT